MDTRRTRNWSSRQKDGFYGAWFPIIVLKTFSDKCLVRYDEFVNENDNSKHLCGMVQISQIKLIPPNINNTSWVENNVVEVYESNCWWVWKIICHLACATKKFVCFRKNASWCIVPMVSSRLGAIRWCKKNYFATTHYSHGMYFISFKFFFSLFFFFL